MPSLGELKLGFIDILINYEHYKYNTILKHRIKFLLEIHTCRNICLIK